jgi:hypothetical protein
MRNRRLAPLTGALALVLALGACAPQAGGTTAPPAVRATAALLSPDEIAATMAPTMTMASERAMPADAAAPAASDAQRINFPAEGSTATSSGTLPPNALAKYVLALDAGKKLIVATTGTPNPVSVSVYGADGTVLQSPMGGSANFDGDIPSTQDYYVDIVAGSEATSYNVMFTAPVQ